MSTYFISGHLDVTLEEFSKHYHTPITEARNAGHCFVIGDAKGVDAMAQVFLKGYDKVTVFHMFEKPRHNENFPVIGGFKNDEDRDSAMTWASDLDIAWVRPGREKSGTAKNIARRLLCK